MYGFKELLTFVNRMQTQNIITSTQNPKIKALLSLQQKSSCRKEKQLFVVEGRRELMHCLSRGYTVETVFLCPDILRAEQEYDSLMHTLPSCNTIHVAPNVYDRIAYRSGTEGVVATICMKEHGLETLPVASEGHAPLYVVLESVEKPGNLGAILRSAGAAGADALIYKSFQSNGQTDYLMYTVNIFGGFFLIIVLWLLMMIIVRIICRIKRYEAAATFGGAAQLIGSFLLWSGGIAALCGFILSFLLDQALVYYGTIGIMALVLVIRTIVFVAKQNPAESN